MQHKHVALGVTVAGAPLAAIDLVVVGYHIVENGIFIGYVLLGLAVLHFVLGHNAHARLGLVVDSHSSEKHLLEVVELLAVAVGV